MRPLHPRLRWLVAALAACAASAASAAPPPLYVAIGGSEGAPGAARPGDPARVAEELARAGVRVRLVDLTAPDATAADVRAGQLMRAAALRPAVVTVAVGAVDVRAGTSLRVFSRKLQVIADLLHRTARTVVLSTVPVPRRHDPGSTRAVRRRVRSFDWAIVLAARRYGFAVSDLRRSGAGDAAWATSVGESVVDAIVPPPERRLHDATSAVGPAPAARAPGHLRG